MLDELDEDLLHELDDIVRDNQLNTLPFAKSGRAEALLHEKYPQLAMQIDRARRAKLDFINFQAKFAEPGGSFGTSSDILFSEELASGSARSKGRGRQSESASSTAPQTPLMKPLPSGYNLLSGDKMLSHRPSLAALAEQQQPSNAVGSPFVSPSGPRPSVDRSPSSQAFELLPPAMGAAAMGSSLESELPQRNTPSSTEAGGRPWGSSQLSSGKLSMKEIMDQAATRTSNISLGFASQSKAAETPLPTATGSRSSQKERKRQQQSQQGDQSATPQRPASTPWQIVGAKSQSSSRHLGSESKVKAAPTPPLASTPQRVPSTPQLTMRQTVANPPLSGKQKESALSSALATPKTPSIPVQQHRSVSTPQAHATLRPSLAPSTPSTTSTTKAVQIQSVRHTPRSPDLSSTSPTFFMHNSMADILSQQAAEKMEIKEAVAKRSLAEIQQEQEFLTWWDLESRRLAEEEEMAAKAVEKSSSSRGGRSGKGRGGRAVSVGGEQKGAGSAAGEHKSAGRGGRSVSGGNRGRGGGGGGGGGGGAGRGGKVRTATPAPPSSSGPATTPNTS